MTGAAMVIERKRMMNYAAPHPGPLPQRERGRGFSLLELLIVVAIIALLAALVAPRLVGALTDSRVKTTRAQIGLLVSGVEQFYIDVGRYPTQEEGLGALLERPMGVEEDVWHGPYLDKDFVPDDGWGRAFIYTFDERGRYVIRSLGADGRPGGTGENADLDNRTR